MSLRKLSGVGAAWFFWVLLCCTSIPGLGQDFLVKEDSLRFLLKHKYLKISNEKIVYQAELMSRHFPNERVFDSLLTDLIDKAEISRDRTLMAMTYDYISKLYLGYYSNNEYSEKGKFYADKCLQVANEGGLENFKISAYLHYSRYYLSIAQKQKALSYNNEAISLASTIGSDSLLSLCYLSFSETWEGFANRLSQFQAILSERDAAEKSKIHSLILRSYYNLGTFYEDMNDYEKAKDSYSLCILRGKEWHYYWPVFNSLRAMGRTYWDQKNETLGLLFFDKSIRLADSLSLSNFRVQAYLDILNHYFNASDPGKGFTFLKAHPDVVFFIHKMGFDYQVNKLNSYLQFTRRNFDSALYYMKVALPTILGKKGNFEEKFHSSVQMAEIYKQMRNYDEEAYFLTSARKFADSSQNLYELRDVFYSLDSVYYFIGNYKLSLAYLGEADKYRDSIQSLSKQKDMLNIEILNENKRAEAKKREDEASTRARYNLEYLGITAAIATVFIIMVILGVFKISASIIKGMGFFAFIFLFEFIVLLLDRVIHEVTHGEPWKVLGVKIVIIAMLLPLHHYLEERMLHYLTLKAYLIKPKLFRKVPEDA